MRKEKSTKKNQPPKIYVSETKKLDITKLENEFYRADLILHGLDHSGPSYQGKVFLNNPNANHETPNDPIQGYVGSFFIFGHGGCLGNIGHCDALRPSTRFNMIPNQLLPETISLKITNKLKELGKTNKEFTITIVPELANGSEIVCQDDADLNNVIKLDRISIETYDKDEEIKD